MINTKWSILALVILFHLVFAKIPRLVVENEQPVQNTIRFSMVSIFKNAHESTLSTDGKFLALIRNDSVNVVNLLKGTNIIHIAPDSVTMLGAKFSPGSSSLAIAYKIIENAQTLRFKVEVWNVSTGKETISLPVVIDQWYRNIGDLSFSKDSQLLASNLGGIARLWNLSDGSEYKRFLPPDNKSDIQSERVLLSPDGNRLAVYFKRQNPAFDVIRVWNLSDQKYVDLKTNIYSDWEFSKDSKLLAITVIEKKGLSDEHSSVEIWDVSKAARVTTIEVPKEWRGGFVTAISPDASMVAIGGYKKFGLFDIKTGALLGEGKHTDSGFFKDSESVNELSDIEFSPDGKTLLTGGNDNKVKLWRIER